MLVALIGFEVFIGKSNKNKQLVIVIIISQLFCFFAVGRVQTFDTHKYYLLTIGLQLSHLCLALEN
jgi:hypothetical protein